MKSNDPVQFFISCPPGLEQLLASECASLGLSHKSTTQKTSPVYKAISGEETGGFSFEGTLEEVYASNLQLRIASRVVIRLGEFFSASFSELRKKASKLAWEKYLQPGQNINIRAVCHKSRLYHSDAVIERILGAINDHFASATKTIRPITLSTDGQLILVRLVNDFCTVSIDSSGEHLYKRGYKQAVAKAPLRENLAAAMVAFSGWDGGNPLIDPFCGSGTIPIEAALSASKIPPGIARHFRFTDWPGFNKQDWNLVIDKSKREIRNSKLSVFGYDRDAGAIENAKENAARAGQKKQIEFLQQAISYLEPPAGTGVIITNPPYGVRISENRDLRDLYARFGAILLEKFKGWSVVLLSSEDRLTGNLGFCQPESFLHFTNGGIPVKLLKFRL
ncbi:MAG: class I SAM-dependent RNA methyltransferase [Anaerolineaceae bacterium]|nr:class I SAM-dependent RNA methyltransferase [Anaerolineaceae bacterium]